MPFDFFALEESLCCDLLLPFSVQSNDMRGLFGEQEIMALLHFTKGLACEEGAGREDLVDATDPIAGKHPAFPRFQVFGYLFNFIDLFSSLFPVFAQEKPTKNTSAFRKDRQAAIKFFRVP